MQQHYLIWRALAALIRRQSCVACLAKLAADTPVARIARLVVFLKQLVRELREVVHREVVEARSYNGANIQLRVFNTRIQHVLVTCVPSAVALGRDASQSFSHERVTLILLQQ